jgi:hypothetical protein
MTCTACEQAKENRWCGAYHAWCLECSARALAASHEYWQANKDGRFTAAYRQALHSIFGEQWEAGHARVKAWAESKSN